MSYLFEGATLHNLGFKEMAGLGRDESEPLLFNEQSSSSW